MRHGTPYSRVRMPRCERIVPATHTTPAKSPRTGAVSVPPESSMIAIVPSGTPSVSIVITVSTVDTNRAVPVTSCLARKTLSPAPMIGRPCSSVSSAPVPFAASTGLYLSGSSCADTTADISNR